MLERAQLHANPIGLALMLVSIAGMLMVLPLTTIIVIGGVLALVAILRWHELALYALIWAIPYGSWFPVPTGFGNLTAVDLFVVLVLALWLARMIAQDRAIVIRFPPLTLPLVLFLSVALGSTIGALSLEASVKEVAKWGELLAIYLYTANTLTESHLKRVLVVMLLAGLSEAAIGIYQFWFRVGPEGFLLFDRFIRAYGTFEQPNPFAGYLALFIPVALGIVSGFRFQVLSSLRAHLATWNLELVSLVALAGMLAAVLMSWSRGAWLGVGVGMIVTIIVQSRRAFLFSIIATFVLSLAILLSSINIIPTTIADRFAGVADYFGVFDVRGVKVDDTNYAIVERMAHWQAAALMWADKPILGVGIGNYAAAYPPYALPHWDDPLGHAHNYYLNLAAETGTLGLLAYLMLWAIVFWQSWRTVRTARGWWRSIAAGMLGTFIALSIHNGFDNLFVHGMAVQVGIHLGIIAAINSLG